MKKFLQSKLLTSAVLGIFIVVNVGCGYILHPERRTAPLSDRVDGGTILLDCLWFLAGIAPGVIALVVDGVNGTWHYTEQELQAKEKEISLHAGQEIILRVAGTAPRDAEISLSLVNRHDDVIQQTVNTIKAGQTLDVLSFHIPDNLQSKQAQLILAVNGERQFTWDLYLQ